MLMISRGVPGGGDEREALPRGIVVLDRVPAQGPPQVQAFVWCKRGRGEPGIFENGGHTVRRTAMLMVGLARENPEG